MMSNVAFAVICSFCAHRFTPECGDDGRYAYSDADGALCCDDCLCADCDRGHATDTARLDCEEGFAAPETGWFDADPDVEYDRFRDQALAS